MAPSLLLVPDLSGMNNQHANPSQSQSRNEVWRTETVIQVFIDIWMSVEESFTSGIMNNSRNAISSLSAERVRIVRVLVKHIHAFASKHQSDPAQRSAALRKYAGQIMSAKAYRYVKYLVETWPLDASFRLVLELWLSLIQPWRYTGNVNYMGQESNSRNNNQEENNKAVDASYTQFIAENFPSYTCILQMIIPRFMRLDLIAPKNAVLLFRLGKVFSQQNLVPILIEIEQSITENPSGSYQVTDLSFNSSFDNQSERFSASLSSSSSYYPLPFTFRYQSIPPISNVLFLPKRLTMSTGDPILWGSSVCLYVFSEDMITPFEEMPDVSMENSSFMNTNFFPQKITDKYQEHFRDLWTRNDIWGYVTREILQKPCTIQTYTKDALSHRGITSHELPARLSLRRLASHAFMHKKSMTHCRAPPEPSERAMARNERFLFHSIGRCVRVEERQRPHTTYT
ncbi:Sphingomyelin phosphodiesterase 4 [Eumeta japonica]|uniref:Sphingomyelin phosphodiesterase 4 n=1 Tax=Eumeta variegata TaxID=151549 RepID=A0A4C1ZV04_EUMVA|nr:Sphingomyelin phosphodiesterase 4 [Eumeta japonica]